VSEHRTAAGRKASTRFIIIDSQSVPNADTAHDKGYDGGQQVSGIKRHIGVDTQGLPHVLHVTTAHVDDRKGALEAIQQGGAELKSVESVLGDGGYTGEPFAQSVAEEFQASVQIAQRPLTSAFEVIPQRWVVERSFAWLEQCRRLWKNCERYLNTRLQFVNLAFLALLLRRL
jgi:transposase